jgi:hypothetical protein
VLDASTVGDSEQRMANVRFGAQVREATLGDDLSSAQCWTTRWFSIRNTPQVEPDRGRAVVIGYQ